jgi:hypothetical protein
MAAKVADYRKTYMARTPVVHGPRPNGDEQLAAGPALYIGNFHKTLKHNDFGEVDPAQYGAFIDIAAHGDFEDVPECSPGHTARLVDPQCGRATDVLGPDPLHVEMQPAPRVLGQSIAAELTELYWMALFRDSPFETWTGPNTADAIADLTTAFNSGLGDVGDPGRLQLGIDLPANGGALNLTSQTLFRAGLPDEDKGPLISQFLLQDFNYGAHLISQTVVPYRHGRDHLLSHADWLMAQNTGNDSHGNDYSSDNSWAADKTYYDDPPVGAVFPTRVRLRNMRDLARFVNRDALHQAYFNAALQLLNWGGAAPADPGNPYATVYKRQGGFGTLGGPNLLALVSEVSSRALKVVWRQKWLVHRRLRPEVYGGIMQMQENGLNGTKRPYGLPAWVFTTTAAQAVQNANADAFFLPMAYSAGSPAHPSYGAGHASVAGACVTILKAWFKDGSFQNIITAASNPGKDPGPPPGIVQPGTNNPDGSLPPYTGGDKAQMTLHGELNKLAANVAMGRSMGGVHWRSDNTRSLRLGERVATIMLRRQLPTYAERPLQLSYVNFDGDEVTIESNGRVTVQNDPELTEFYSNF